MGVLPWSEWQPQFPQLSNGTVIPAARSGAPGPAVPPLGHRQHRLRPRGPKLKPKPPLPGESPTELGFGPLSRQGWFDLQSTGSSRGWTGSPGRKAARRERFWTAIRRVMRVLGTPPWLTRRD